jgi:hypothetical protein
MVLLRLLQCKAVISIWRIRMIFWSYRIGDPSVLTSQKSAQLLIQSTNVCSMKFVRKSFLCGELHVNWITFWSYRIVGDPSILTSPESTAWVFPLYFQLPYLPEGTCFQQAGSSVVKAISQAILVSLAYWPRAQISNHHRACTKALLLYKKHQGFLYVFQIIQTVSSCDSALNLL